jgi:hypothetical protein
VPDEPDDGARRTGEPVAGRPGPAADSGAIAGDARRDLIRPPTNNDRRTTMGANRGTADWRKLGLLLSPLGLAGCGKTTESYVAGFPDKEWPAHSFLADRAAVKDPLGRQAANGAVAGATLFNYHFRPNQTFKEGGQIADVPGERLSPWGADLLARLSRHPTGGHVCVYVQTAWDEAAATAGGPAVQTKARLKLDQERLTTVREFLAVVRPDLAATVELIGLDPVGMAGPEARNGLGKLYTAPRGFLERDAILGAEIGAGQSTIQGGSSPGPAPGQVAPPQTPDAPPQPGSAPGGLAPGTSGAGGVAGGGEM